MDKGATKNHPSIHLELWGRLPTRSEICVGSWRMCRSPTNQGMRVRRAFTTERIVCIKHKGIIFFLDLCGWTKMREKDAYIGPKENKQGQELGWPYVPSKEFGIDPDNVGLKQYRMCYLTCWVEPNSGPYKSPLSLPLVVNEMVELSEEIQSYFKSVSQIQWPLWILYNHPPNSMHMCL